MLGYALAATGPLDALAITCVDRLAGLPELRVCRRYHHGDELVERLRLGPLDTVRDPHALLDLLEAELGMPIGIVSRGPTAADKTIQPALRV